MSQIASPVLLLGCGKMGGAMARGWLAGGLERLVVVEPSADGLGGLLADARVSHFPSAAALPADLAPAAVVLAVKPQMMDGALPDLKRFAADKPLFVSIAAGKTLDYFAGYFGAAPIVRSMPNLPASIGRGMTVAVPNAAVSAAQRAQADQLLAACGEVAWVEDEGMLDAVTALSGGGPAYLFLLVEALAEAGVKVGLPADLAMRLARVTMAGSGELLAQSDLPAAQLRQNVTSPGGTTKAALEVLMAEDAIQPLVTRAIAAATARSRELGKPS